MIYLKVDKTLCSGCCNCYYILHAGREEIMRKDGVAFIRTLPEMPEMAFGEGCKISDQFAEENSDKLQSAYENCLTGALTLEEP